MTNKIKTSVLLLLTAVVSGFAQEKEEDYKWQISVSTTPRVLQEDAFKPQEGLMKDN